MQTIVIWNVSPKYNRITMPLVLVKRGPWVIVAREIKYGAKHVSLVLKLTCERAFTVDLHTKTDAAGPGDRHQADVAANLRYRQSVGHDGVAVDITGEDLQWKRKINPLLNELWLKRIKLSMLNNTYISMFNACPFVSIEVIFWWHQFLVFET